MKKLSLAGIAVLLLASAFAEFSVKTVRQTVYDYTCVDEWGAVLSGHH